MPESILQFENVTVAFDGNPAIEELSFEIFKGEARIIVGASGSGKTVILKTALGLLRPDSGRVFLFGEDITGRKEQQLFDIRARAGMLFQEGALFDSLTIEENVAYPLVNQKMVKCPPGEVRPRVERALSFVELGHTLDKFPSELSGGMRRRVGIARANITQPDLVLYDSPTAGLDPITANNIMSLIVKERDLRHATTIIVTQRFQDGQIMAQYRYNPDTDFLERVQGQTEGIGFLVMKEGRLVFEGSAKQLRQVTDPYISKFVLRH